MKKVTKKVVAPKAKAKIVKKPVRKYEPGGVVGVTPKKTKTAAELAQEAEGKGSSVVASAAEVPGITKAALPKKRTDGFASDAQKAAYIKNAKSMLASGKSIDDLVKSKFGTKAGLAALGLKDSPKASSKAEPVPSKTESQSSLAGKIQKEKGTFKKEDGQKLKAEGLRQKGIGMAIKGKGLRNKAIANTLYKGKYSSEASKALIKMGADPKKPNLALKASEAMSQALGGLEMLYKGKNRYSTEGRSSKSELTKTEKEALAKNKKSQASKQAKRAAEFTKTGKYSMYKKGGKTVTKKK
jgi:hypothetical protein